MSMYCVFLHTSKYCIQYHFKRNLGVLMLAIVYVFLY